MDERAFLDVISGRRSDTRAALLRSALSFAATGYEAGIALRNAAFDRGWRRVYQVDVPVISVGNLTTGGTGKTPFVSWLVTELERRGLTPGLLSRGYRSPSSPPLPRGGWGGPNVAQPPLPIREGEAPAEPRAFRETHEDDSVANESFENSSSRVPSPPPNPPLAGGAKEARRRAGLQAQAAGNDEARVLAWRHPRVPHRQNPNRVLGARDLLSQVACDALVLDDAFQHRRLHRDLDIVLIDALQPWGYGHLLPRGLLREPPESLRRADVVVITRADQISSEQLEELRHQIRHLRGQPVDGEVAFQPTQLVNADGQTRALSALAESSVAAFCGLGNPAGFERTLQQLGASGPCQAFPDHHHYTTDDLAALDGWRQSLGAEALLTTLKDLVKVPPRHPAAAHIWAVDIDVAWLRGRDQVESRLVGVLQWLSTRAAA